MRRAFTLIELLVVIAIITILAAILFPVFSRAKTAAKTTQCLTHMKQVGMGMQLYTDDHDDVWPAACNATPVPGFAEQNPWIGYDNFNTGGINPTGWYGDPSKPARYAPHPGMVDPYLKSRAVTVCPAKPAEWQMALAYNWFNTDPRFRNMPYYMSNPGAWGNEYGPGGKNCVLNSRGFMECEGVNGSEFEEASNTLSLWEHGGPAPACQFLQIYDWQDAPPQYDANLKHHFNFLHFEGSVTIWADGHAKRMVYDQLKRPMFSVKKSFYAP